LSLGGLMNIFATPLPELAPSPATEKMPASQRRKWHWRHFFDFSSWGARDANKLHFCAQQFLTHMRSFRGRMPPQ
jgi:hypothetical protein